TDPLVLEQPSRCLDQVVNCNLYSYFKNSPANYKDPTGKLPSKSFDVAATFSNKVYVVRPVNGIEVNQALGDLSPFPWEQEIAVPGSIAPRDDRAVTLPDKGVSILNPNYKQ